MKLNLKKLLAEKKIEKIEKKKLDLTFSKKDLEFAKKGVEIENYSGAMSVAYQTVLKTATKLAASIGYRAIGKEHHKNLFKILLAIGFDKDLINYFNKIRIRRNDFVYRDIDNISKDEAEEIVQKAEKFVQKTRTFVHKKRT